MAESSSGRLWAVILADDSPSEPPDFAPVFFSHDEAAAPSVLSRTLRRTQLAIPPESTVVVGTRHDHPRLARETSTFPGNVLIQPRDRGSAARLLWPIYWIHRFDPDAVVVLIPARCQMREGSVFMDHVVRVVERVRHDPRWIVIVGARPVDPEPDHDWIIRAECLNDDRERVWRVRDLQDGSVLPGQPRNGLWNTRVVVGQARTFLDAAKTCLPRLHAAFAEASQHAGTWEEPAALEAAYARLAVFEFFPALRDAAFPRIAASCLPPLHWSDSGASKDRTQKGPVQRVA